GLSTVGRRSSIGGLPFPDVTFMLRGDVPVNRIVEVTTCFPGATPWPSVIFVFNGLPSSCLASPGPGFQIAADMGSDAVCGGGAARTTFLADAGLDYYLVSCRPCFAL
ncbi:hypothetical protein HaLaN_15390, partial [Haematococcus lacustris]